MFRVSSISAILCALLLSAAPSSAQTTQPDAPLAQRLEEYKKLEQQLAALFAQKDFEKAIDVCRKQIQLVPELGEPHYNLACSLARVGKKDPAILELGQAVDHGFVDAGHMREDADLETLRDDPRFKDVLKKARDKQLNAPHETAGEIKGVKMIEGFPEQGLRYRLRMDPAATAQKPARLVIWLHPSGGSMDNAVEPLSAEFAKAGYALLVFTQKNFNFWTPADAAALMQRTLPDVAKIPGIDAKRPILLGFSAGGQLALQLWQAHPADFGALILDAAYPIDPQRLAQRQVVALPLPQSDAIQKCPVFVLVGGLDGGSQLWKLVEKSWRDAKIPLTIHIIPGKKHEWLLDKTQTTAIAGWLKKIAAGELPSELPDPNAPKEPPHDTVGPPIKI